MSPEERAAATLKAMDDRCAFDPSDSDHEILTAAIRAAEVEARREADTARDLDMSTEEINGDRMRIEIRILVRMLGRAQHAATEARREAESVVAGMREAVLEFELSPPDGEFVSISPDGKVYATHPDRVRGYFAALDARWKSADVKRWSEEFRTARDRAAAAEAALAGARREALEEAARALWDDARWGFREAATVVRGLAHKGIGK